MSLNTKAPSADLASLAAAVDAAGRRIPPLWPLASTVAVNPYLGQTGECLAVAGARLGRIGAGPVIMPRRWYLDRIESGTITDTDLADALASSPHAGKPADVETLKRAAKELPQEVRSLPTVAEVAAEDSGIDWPGIVADRIAAWAGSYFDAGQALWISPQEKEAWTAYRTYATHDITPEIMGLQGFAAFVDELPESSLEAVARAVDRLGLDGAALETYFHQLLLTLGGWAQLARYRLWRSELAEGSDTALADMLAIRLLWEEALYLQYEQEVSREWARVREAHATPIVAAEDAVADEILQEAAERAAQRRISETLGAPLEPTTGGRPSLQAAFCIDVRSEVFRRALEGISSSIQTLGFAGFFGVFANHRRFASDVRERRLPVLLNPTVDSCATGPDNEEADRDTRFRARARRAWGRFKLAAVSSFAFVEAMGPIYGVKLLRDALRLRPAATPNDPKPRFEPDLDLPARVAAAETVLSAMSLKTDFARIVLLCGHGASVVNNPFASGLHCGACGGYSGEVNARLLAGLLNDPEVRDGLAGRGIDVPADTLFVAALHETTTDSITLYDKDVDASAHLEELREVRAWLAMAGKAARAERALRLPRAADANDIPRRARDWAEVRPEWGLAGCEAFIAAPRSRTTGRSFEGRAFLHEYDWKQDSRNGFPVLELILTAPVVVASWISLQYYGSTVAPDTFGSGNKLLHNVVGGIGVFEGNGGALRAGVPWQSVHDGDTYIHEPLRLSVCIEAPREAMTEILKRHQGVRALFDNRWLHLFSLDEMGKMAWRYAGDLSWVCEAEKSPVASQTLRAAS